MSWGSSYDNNRHLGHETARARADADTAAARASQEATDAARLVEGQRRLAEERRKQKRIDSLLNDPGSYAEGVVPEHLAEPAPDSPWPGPGPRLGDAISYPTPEIPLAAWGMLRHPESRHVAVEVTPRVGGRLQIGIDSPGHGRVIVTAEELTRKWKQQRAAGTPLPLELRLAARGPALRWLSLSRSTETETASLLGELAASAGRAAWKAWRQKGK